MRFLWLPDCSGTMERRIHPLGGVNAPLVLPGGWTAYFSPISAQASAYFAVQMSLAL